MSFDRVADRALGARLAERSDLDFEGLLRLLWADHDDVPAALAERFVRNDLVAGARARQVMHDIGALAGRDAFEGASVLEVGSGTAALGAAVARRAGMVVGTDLSRAWLVLARRRAQDEGVANLHLVVASADKLPFRDGSFDMVLGADVIEHVPSSAALVASCTRVLRPGGGLWLSTPNRYSLSPEPHVGLWGVGFLPRRFADTYVRRRRGVDYSDVHTLSAPALRRALRRTGGQVRVVAPAIPSTVRAGYPPALRRVIGAYNLVTRARGLRRALVVIAPLFHGLVVKPGRPLRAREPTT